VMLQALLNLSMRSGHPSSARTFPQSFGKRFNFPAMSS
jgi:hypothetical protein